MDDPKTTPIIISHKSAGNFWLSAANPSSAYARLDELKPPYSYSQLEFFLAGQSTSPFGIGPLDVLVFDKQARRKRPFCTFHSCSYDLPRGAIVDSGKGLFLASPELVLLQLGRTCSIAQLSEYASNICGLFFQDAYNKALRQREKPLSTPAKLRAFVSLCPSMHGTTKASRCLRWVTSNSASPMETKLLLRLSLPCAMGGYGFPMPVLNHRIDPGRQQNFAEQKWYVADLCWPNRRIIVEYDGASYHQDAVKDKRRTNALEAMGWKVFCVTKELMFDASSFHAFAKQLARALGIRQRFLANWTERAVRLQNELNVSSPSTAIWGAN